MKDWSEVTLKITDTLGTAIQVLHTGGLRVALVVDNYGKLFCHRLYNFSFLLPLSYSGLWDTFTQHPGRGTVALLYAAFQPELGSWRCTVGPFRRI